MGDPISVPAPLRALAGRIDTDNAIRDEARNILSASELRRALASHIFNTDEVASIAALQGLMLDGGVTTLVIDPAKPTAPADLAVAPTSPDVARLHQASREMSNAIENLPNFLIDSAGNNPFTLDRMAEDARGLAARIESLSPSAAAILRQEAATNTTAAFDAVEKRTHFEFAFVYVERYRTAYRKAAESLMEQYDLARGQPRQTETERARVNLAASALAANPTDDAVRADAAAILADGGVLPRQRALLEGLLKAKDCKGADPGIVSAIVDRIVDPSYGATEAAKALTRAAYQKALDELTPSVVRTLSADQRAAIIERLLATGGFMSDLDSGTKAARDKLFMNLLSTMTDADLAIVLSRVYRDPHGHLLTFGSATTAAYQTFLGDRVASLPVQISAPVFKAELIAGYKQLNAGLLSTDPDAAQSALAFTRAIIDGGDESTAAGIRAFVPAFNVMNRRY